MSAFKKSLSALGVSAALVISAQAFAATDATLSVTGTVVPAACTPTLSNSGVVSFGSIAASSIRAAQSGNTLVQLGAKDITLTISCDARTAVGFTARDNRSSSAVALSSESFIASVMSGENGAKNAMYGFGLGNASNNAKIGAYTLFVDAANVTADGVSASSIFSEDKQTWVKSTTATRLTNTGTLTATLSDTVNEAPVLFQEGVFPLKIAAALQTSSVLGFDEINLDGSVTLSVVYL